MKPWLMGHFNWYPSLGRDMFSILEEKRHMTEVWSEDGAFFLLALLFSVQYWANNHFFGDILGSWKWSKRGGKWLSFKNVSPLRNKLNCKRWNLLIPEENLFVYFFLSEYSVTCSSIRGEDLISVCVKTFGIHKLECSVWLQMVIVSVFIT